MSRRRPTLWDATDILLVATVILCVLYVAWLYLAP
jgi:hypothetical protein